MDAVKFKKIVQQIVREEIKKSVKPMIKECLGELMLEQMAHRPLDNTKKAITLRESSAAVDMSEYDEYPSMTSKPSMDRSALAEMLGYGDMTQQANSFHAKPAVPSIVPGQQGNMITLDSRISDEGNVLPITQDQIPDAVLKAMNRDYRPLMQQFNTNSGVGA